VYTTIFEERREHTMSRKLGTILVLLAGIIAVLAAWASTSRTAYAEGAKRTIYMAAIEPKGSTTVAKEPFPTAKLPPGAGYGLKAPQGDEVTLEILGVNGKEHHAVIEDYSINFTVRRGQVIRVNFKANKAGIFKIVCNVHRPAMTGQLVVLPRR
jgi:hypothetical protein